MAARKVSPTKKAAAKKAAPAKKVAAKKSPTSATSRRSAPGTEAQKHRATPEPLGARGRRIWAALEDLIEGEGGAVLLEEACRIADRLDKLDALLQGDADVWTRIFFVNEFVGELRIDSALIEARQQANVLRQLVAALPLKKEPPGDGEEGDDWTEGL